MAEARHDIHRSTAPGARGGPPTWPGHGRAWRGSPQRTGSHGQAGAGGAGGEVRIWRERSLGGVSPGGSSPGPSREGGKWFRGGRGGPLSFQRPEPTSCPPCFKRERERNCEAWGEGATRHVRLPPLTGRGPAPAGVLPFIQILVVRVGSQVRGAFRTPGEAPTCCAGLVVSPSLPGVDQTSKHGPDGSIGGASSWGRSRGDLCPGGRVLLCDRLIVLVGLGTIVV